MAIPPVQISAEVLERLLKVEDYVSKIDKKQDGLEERLAKATAEVYREREKLNIASTKMVKGKDTLKIVGESGLGVGGLATTIAGIFVTAIPGGAIIGIPMIAAGVASTSTGGVLMGGTHGQRFITLIIDYLSHLFLTSFFFGFSQNQYPYGLGMPKPFSGCSWRSHTRALSVRLLENGR